MGCEGSNQFHQRHPERPDVTIGHPENRNRRHRRIELLHGGRERLFQRLKSARLRKIKPRGPLSWPRQHDVLWRSRSYLAITRSGADSPGPETAIKPLRNGPPSPRNSTEPAPRAQERSPSRPPPMRNQMNSHHRHYKRPPELNAEHVRPRQSDIELRPKPILHDDQILDRRR